MNCVYVVGTTLIERKHRLYSNKTLKDGWRDLSRRYRKWSKEVELSSDLTPERRTQGMFRE